MKFGANKPVTIPVPQDDGRKLEAVGLASQFPQHPGAEHPGRPTTSRPTRPRRSRSRFYDVQVALYSGLSPMEPGLPAIDADPIKALDEAYTTAPPQLLSRSGAAGRVPGRGRPRLRWPSRAPTPAISERAPEGGFQWDLRGLARHEHHRGLRSLGVRVLFRVNAAARRLEAAQIDSELGSLTPGQPRWELAKKLALCAVDDRRLDGPPLQRRAPGRRRPLAIATRNCLPAAHPLRRLLWPHMFGTQYSNELVTKGQMSPGRRLRLDLQPDPPRDVRAIPGDLRAVRPHRARPAPRRASAAASSAPASTRRHWPTARRTST